MLFYFSNLFHLSFISSSLCPLFLFYLKFIHPSNYLLNPISYLSLPIYFLFLLLSFLSHHINPIQSNNRALKRDVTRLGKRTKQGAFDDGVNSAMRYFINNYQDETRQKGIDILLGYATIDGEQCKVHTYIHTYIHTNTHTHEYTEE